METQQSAWLRRLKAYMAGRAAIAAWRRFGCEVRTQGCRLLRCLGDYPDAVLVAGCQRSGTTMLARLITASEGMVDYYFGVDDEHDAALLLSGHRKKSIEGRYCFQTTYLNECYKEYAETESSYRLIWVVRNPYSVVNSFLYNWSRFALNELFEACGAGILDESAAWRFARFGRYGLSRLERGCYAYAGKTAQIAVVRKMLPREKLLIVDYDRLVRNKHQLLPKIYEFIDLPYRQAYAERINSASLDKMSRLTARERRVIERVCVPVYDEVSGLVDL